jgi:hypothetical protein
MSFARVIAVIALAHSVARAECALDTKIIPLPVWATTPNEGNTWGAMPVFLRVCPTDHETHWILAPSITWNSIIHFTATIRWFDYPAPDERLYIIAGASTRLAYNFIVEWQKLPLDPWSWTDEATARVERSPFDRFYGIGPLTPGSAETSFTGTRILASERRGLNLADHVNLGLSLSFERDGVQDVGVPDLPLSPEVFPDAPGMHGATLLSEGFDIRYDDRVGLEFADVGTRAGFSAAVVEGLSGSPDFVRFGADARTIVPELSWLSGAARFAWTSVSSSAVPFYQQSQLGGAFLLRGFQEGRFVDRQAWTIDVEQRIRVLQTKIFGVNTDWRVDPFISVGQVFGDIHEAVSHPRYAGGLGLRAFVHPNVLGRIDLAVAGEGLKVYVELGYPY